jgi:DNA-binding CsgD family transcriptional regulator
VFDEVSSSRRIEPEFFVVDGVRYALVPLPDPRAAIEALPLSQAEREVVVLLASGRSTREIARARGVSPRTIDKQLASVYRKVGVSSRDELLVHLGRCGPRE